LERSKQAAEEKAANTTDKKPCPEPVKAKPAKKSSKSPKF